MTAGSASSPGGMPPDRPGYRAIRQKPTRGFPESIVALEASEAYTARVSAVRHWLLEATRRPEADRPLFVALLVPGRGLVTQPLPDGSHALLVFTSPLRADDYARTIHPATTDMQYALSTPAELVHILRDLRPRGVTQWAIDRCPRCDVFWTVDGEAATADDVVGPWTLAVASCRVRAEQCLRVALDAALAGRLEEARDVALETVSHVTEEDARFHMLLGQLAVASGTAAQVEEARGYLRALGALEGLASLEGAARTGAADFTALADGLLTGPV
ncbi:MAG: hypothetical protein AB7G23_12610 [Vicinamibacterales bacterium]